MASPEDCRAYKAETFRLQEERNLPLPYFDAGFDVKLDEAIFSPCTSWVHVRALILISFLT
jgi:hypothetical protein